jgi:RNA polymerase sigma factor (sigma-70 family)
MKQESDAELVSICVSDRGPEVWSRFMERFGTRLTMGVRRAFRRAGIFPRAVDLEDLLQEVYCRLLASGARVLRNCRGRHENEVSAYLGRVAESVVLDHLRAGAAEKRGRNIVIEQYPWQEFEVCDLAADRGPSPEERILNRERKQALLSQCRRKSSGPSANKELWVFYLAFFEGWTSREISRHLRGGLTPGSVDCVVHRLRKRLSSQGMQLPRR